MARRTISAWLKGMENRLRAADALNDQPAETYGRIAGVKPDGRPPNGCGQWYYAIHFAGLRSDDPGAQSSDSLLDASVTITRRMSYAPKDRKGSVTISADELLDQADYIKDLFHMDQQTRILANKEMGMNDSEAAAGRSAAVNGFVECQKYASVSPITEVGPEWVGANPEQGERNIYTVQIRFVGARLVKGMW